MIFYYHDDEHNNFGDELNRWLWPKLVPDHILNAESDATVYGIGTVLHDGIAEQPRKVLLGAGTGYGSPPDIDDTYTVYCVRGPLTAQRLGLGSGAACVDPAILVGDFFSYEGDKEYTYAYMPHYHQAIFNGEEWEQICAKAGIHYIDPRLKKGYSFEDVLKEIAKAEVLLSEAMHGAIVADALRVPWIPVRTTSSILAFKWQDWAASLEMEYRPNHIYWKGDALKRSSLIRRMIWEGARIQFQMIRRFVTPQLSDNSIYRQRNEEIKNHIQTFVREIENGKLSL